MIPVGYFANSGSGYGSCWGNHYVSGYGFEPDYPDFGYESDTGTFYGHVYNDGSGYGTIHLHRRRRG